MKVLIDVGNTRMKLGWVDSATGRRESHALALGHHDLPQLAGWLEQLTPAPLGALVVNVAGKAMAAALDALFLGRSAPPVRWHTGLAHAGGGRNEVGRAAGRERGY